MLILFIYEWSITVGFGLIAAGMAADGAPTPAWMAMAGVAAVAFLAPLALLALDRWFDQ